MATRLPKTLALAGALTALLGAGSAHAAFTLSDVTVDGGWADTSGGNRGADLDFIRTTPGNGVLFIALYRYDAQGNPLWLATSVPVHESQFRIANVQLFRFNGGSFGGAPTAATGTPVATATIDFQSCNELKIDIAPTAGSAIPASSLTLAKGEAAVGKAPLQCVYTKKFEACPAGTASIAGVERTCVLSGTYTRDLTLTNDTTWVLSGLVRIGTRNAASANLTIEPGTRITGQGQTSDYLYIEPGSKIFAEGLPYAPIVFTSPKDAAGQTPAPKDWGGVVVSGNAPVNGTSPAPSEFDPNLLFGGSNPTESSGVLRYVQVRYAGYVFAPNREVNAFTFQGVGSGTVVDYIQAYRGGDDGVEFFGGTNNVKHLVVTEGGDDAIDWDLGWNGKLQYALVMHGTGLGEDRGIEAANNPNNSDAAPRATPTLSHLTMIGNGRGSHGIELKQGSGGRIWNSIVTGFPSSCLFLTGAATYAAAGTPASLSGNTVVRNTIFNCGTNFRQDADAPYTTESFASSNAGNSTASADLQGFLPKASSPALNAAAPVSTGTPAAKDDFFEVVPYVGAFRGANDNWTVGWTVGVNQ